MRYLLAAAAAGLAVATAGCGGAEPAATAEAAAPAPPNAGLYVSLDTDRDSAQWQQLDELLKRVPGAQGAVDKLLADALDGAGLDWDEDVAPALGPQVAVVLAGGSSDPVALTQPEDEAKLNTLLAKSDQKLVTRQIEGWTALAESEQALDAYEATLKEGDLAEQPDYTAAMADLPEDALARVYVNNIGLAGLGASVLGTAGANLAGFTPGTLGLAVVAEDDGLRLTGNATQASLPASFSPTLLARVPADALLAATFKGGEAMTEQLHKALGGNNELLRGLEQQLGVSFEDLVSLFGGETLLYVRPGLPIPEVTLALEQTSATQPATVAALFRALAAGAKGQLTTATEDGVSVTRLSLGPVSIAYGATNGMLVVTTGRGGIAALRGGGAKLVDAPAFEQAMEAVGYSGSTSGLVYADVDGLVPLLQGLAGLAGGSTSGLDEVAKALGALDSFAVNVTVNGDQARLEGLLAVR